MYQVGVHEAKTHFSELLRRVASGEEVLITKSGKPMARLSAPAPTRPVPAKRTQGTRPVGMYAGTITIADDFNELPPRNHAVFPVKERYLLDTHCWLWSLMQPERLSAKASETILSQSSSLYLSLASVWEISIIVLSLKKPPTFCHCEPA
jgi:antitoxin (DNA-binding transcriptional repressor) of toxin-antitoxin stability system